MKTYYTHRSIKYSVKRVGQYIDHDNVTKIKCNTYKNIPVLIFSFVCMTEWYRQVTQDKCSYDH